MQTLGLFNEPVKKGITITGSSLWTKGFFLIKWNKCHLTDSSCDAESSLSLENCAFFFSDKMWHLSFFDSFFLCIKELTYWVESFWHLIYLFFLTQLFPPYPFLYRIFTHLPTQTCIHESKMEDTHIHSHSFLVHVNDRKKIKQTKTKNRKQNKGGVPC